MIINTKIIITLIYRYDISHYMFIENSARTQTIIDNELTYKHNILTLGLKKLFLRLKMFHYNYHYYFIFFYVARQITSNILKKI